MTISDPPSRAARRAWSFATSLLAPAALAISVAKFGPGLPKRVAIHFDANGAADGYGSPWPLFAFAAVVAVASVAVSAATVTRSDSTSAALGCFASQAIANCLTVGWIIVAYVSHEANPHLTAAATLGIIVLAIGVAFLPYVLLRSMSPKPEWKSVDALPLSSTERLAWIGTSGSPVILIFGVVVGGLGVGLLFVGLSSGHPSAPEVGIDALLMIVGVALIGLARVTISIDRRGLRVRTALLGVPLIREPLENVKSCSITTASIADWGGWGFRIASRGTAYVANSGPAIVVELQSGRIRLITLPQPQEPAEVLQALLC